MAPDVVDVTRFERRIREGTALIERRRFRRAAEVLAGALELWRGRPFTGLAEDGPLLGEAVRLEELRLLALESRLEADLEIGRAAGIVEELEALVAEHPFRERLWRHLMLALYRSGRQADALAAYHRARIALDEQLGIEPSQEIRDIEAAILRQDLPPPAAERGTAAGLPVPLTTFIGRRRELEDVPALLERSRLVTLVGVGGVGKTRLAIEVARGAAERLVDTVAFVDLAALSDPGLVANHVAAAIGLREAAAGDLAAALAERLAGADLLLVLDNCEHVREAVARLALALLTSSSDLRILATSRVVLDIAGEAPYPVPPMALPEGPDEGEAAQASDAVRLLLDRAVLTRHDLRVDDAAWTTAARICRELDGLPLAIELAAARTKALSLEEIADRLRDRFRFLVSWRRLSAARHRTLAEAMDWSYELLAPDEQRLLARLSVFPAGATLPAVAEVCLDGDRDAAERLLERLVDASLVVPIETPSGTRYRLLETVRQYAAARLPDTDLPGLRRRHAERARAVAASTNLGLEGPSHAGRFEVAREELPSIRAAIQWAGEADPALAIAIATALERFWAFTRPQEGIAILGELLSSDSLGDEDRARGLRCRGGCRYASGEYAGGIEDYEAALAIHERLGQPAHQAHLLMRIAVEAMRVGDIPRARQLLDQADTIGRDARFASDRYVGLAIEGDLAFEEGREGEGFEMLARAVERARQAGDIVWQLDSLQATAERALDRGRYAVARRAAVESLALAMEIGTRSSVIWGLAILAREAAATGDTRRAGRLWAGLEAEVERGGPVGQWEAEQDAYRAAVLKLAGEGFPAAVATGRTLSLADVVAEALEEP